MVLLREFEIHTAGMDFIAVPTTRISFLTGTTEFSIPLDTLEDNLPEQLEDFAAVLSNPSEGLDIGVQNTATVSILDNDGE